MLPTPSRWHGCLNFHWQWKLNCEFQVIWIQCFSILMADLKELDFLTKWKVLFSAQKGTLDHQATVQYFVSKALKCRLDPAYIYVWWLLNHWQSQCKPCETLLNSWLCLLHNLQLTLLLLYHFQPDFFFFHSTFPLYTWIQNSVNNQRLQLWSILATCSRGGG